MKEVPLSQGMVALVDDEDYERVRQHKWSALKKRHTFYACRMVTRIDGTRKIQYLHNFILGVVGVDHKDGNGLNNRRDNIRPATLQQNSFSHRRKLAGASSEFRGVYWDMGRKKWAAHIKMNRRKKHLGYFLSEDEAARAYDATAIKFFGEFAAPNFPA